MRIYETTFVINPQSDDATIDKHVKDVSGIITSTDGKIIHEDNMGTRRLAYEINGLTQGFYASFLYEAPTEVLPKLDHHFKVNEAYIRNLTIRIEVDPSEVIKQSDPFGKHSDKRDHDDKPGGRTHGRDSAPVKRAPETETPKADAPVKEEAAKVVETKPVETKAVETKPEEAKTETPETDKPAEEL